MHAVVSSLEITHVSIKRHSEKAGTHAEMRYDITSILELG